jgi:O-methyltransferase involved in polyketide biosynthesis
VNYQTGDAPRFDTTVPNVARIYDYFLGGKDNYAADREAAAKIRELIPDAAIACRENRKFLQRVVRYLAEAGIRQFIDIGTGLPTRGNVHEIAQKHAPGACVVYVDYDPVVVSHATAFLAGDNVTAIRGDLRSPEEILSNPDLTKLIDLSEPVAILLIAVLHFIKDDEDPPGFLKTLKQAMAPGSYLAISHITGDQIAKEDSLAAQDIYTNASAPVVPRTHEEIIQFFDHLMLINPGLVNISKWPAELSVHGSTSRQLFYGGIAVKN